MLCLELSLMVKGGLIYKPSSCP